MDARLKLHARLIDEIDLSKLDKLDENEMRRQVRSLVGDFAREERLPLNGAELDELGASVFDEMVGLGPIEPLLQDNSIADILINGPNKVYVERHGELKSRRSASATTTTCCASSTASSPPSGGGSTKSSPMVDARLADGSRVNAAIAPVAIDGAAVSIRKFSKKPYDLQRLVERGRDAGLRRRVPVRRGALAGLDGDLRRHGLGQDHAAERPVRRPSTTRSG